MSEIKIKDYNLVYIDCTDFIIESLTSIASLNIVKFKVSDKKKLITHYLIKLLLKKSKLKTGSNRPVYFVQNNIFDILDNDYANLYRLVISKIKSMLPVPLIVIDDREIFLKNNGELKGLNEKIMSFYHHRKVSTKKLSKYLETEEFYELIKVLNNVSNIASLST